MYAVDDNELVMPSTEHKLRKKCAILDDGLAIKYNKLVHNFDKILAFRNFRRYCVFFDIFSKRHLINHCYRIDLLEQLNCYDFTPYAFENCYCKCSVLKTCTGYITAFKSDFMHRKKYSNHADNKSQSMKSLYAKHSILHEENNFYDNRINECFRQKIQSFEKLKTIIDLDRKSMRTLHKNMYQSLPDVSVCRKCKNFLSTDFNTWSVIRYSNIININNLCDIVLNVDNTFYTPTYHLNETTSSLNENTRIFVYKSTKSNIVFIHENIFYVIHPNNVIVIFDIPTFRKVRFFCNFMFHFVEKTPLEINNNNNFIHINKF